MSHEELVSLTEGQPIVYAGNRVARVSAELAQVFSAGDRIVVDPTSGQILHIPSDVDRLADGAVKLGREAFGGLGLCSDDQVSAFFRRFADRLEDDDSFAPIAAANQTDVSDARSRGRSVTRLILDDTMRSAMIAGLRGWADQPGERSQQVAAWNHSDWTVVARRAPLGVVGFVFEGRPNVFADAAGVIRTGNTAVFRIGSDALSTARAIMNHAVEPALAESGLPKGALGLLDAKAHAAGWALFSHPDLGLAVARGSGPAVAQLGAVAKQSGVPVSLHGTGGAWMIIDEDGRHAAPDQDDIDRGDIGRDDLGLHDWDRLADIVSGSLDRKVCNTLNTVCFTANASDAAVAAVVQGIDDAAHQRGVAPRLHITEAAWPLIERIMGSRLADTVEVVRAGGVTPEPFATPLGVDRLGEEWEWEESPEVSIHVVASVDEAVEAFNRWSPRFVLTVISDSDEVFERAYELADAPFVGNGMTRWVDGQFALDAPELGLSNWQNGRMLGRGGILSGDGIYTVRYQADTPAYLRRSPRAVPRLD